MKLIRYLNLTRIGLLIIMETIFLRWNNLKFVKKAR
jgi:hypothetical protein